MNDSLHTQLIPRRRRRQRRRRRFRYRKEAKCLLFAVLFSMVVIYLWTAASIVLQAPYMTETESFVSPIQAIEQKSNISGWWKVLSEAVENIMLAAILLSTARRVILRLRPYCPTMVVVRVAGWRQLFWRSLPLEIRNCFVPRLHEESSTTEAADVYRERTDVSSSEATMSVAESLEIFNRERAARGETTVSAESIVAYERFLRDLARSVVTSGRTNIGNRWSEERKDLTVTWEELEKLCPRWILETRRECLENDHDLYQTECGICLDTFVEETSDCVGTEDRIKDGKTTKMNNPKSSVVNTTLRTLPCRHIFHSHCIDLWLLNRSATCPTCKRCIRETSVNPTL